MTRRGDIARERASPVAGERMLRVAFEGHAGAVHMPERPGDVAVILCPSVGREARCAYRALWVFANRMAEAGVTVLRYDHLGTGDSLPLDPDADQWACWRDGIGAATAFARRRLGARKVVLAGFRLGASLAAAEAAAARADGVMLLAPVESGRAWLREQQMAANLLRGRGEAASPDSAVELDGLRLSAATTASLRAFTLRGSAGASPPLFLASPSPEASPPGWAPDATIAAFDGYEALLLEAHSSQAPEAVFDTAIGWLRRWTPGPPLPADPLPEAVLATADWVERPVRFGAGLQGVLCWPATASPPRRALVIGNTGGDPRAGIGDFAAQACRTLAVRGVAALRFDFAGLGESDGEAAPTHVYETSRQGDFAAAAALLETAGCRKLFLAGVCSGAHHALHAALASARYAGVMAINPARLIWRRGEALGAGGEPPARRRVGLSDLRRRDLWARLLRGDVPWGSVARAQLAAVRQALPSPDRETASLWMRLWRLSRRGGRVRLLIGRWDPAHRELETRFGWHGAHISAMRGISVKVAPDLDHGLFFSASRDHALEEIAAFAGVPVATARSDRRIVRRSRTAVGASSRKVRREAYA